MRDALRKGLIALREGQWDAAEEYLSQAARLAARLGSELVLREIGAVADIEDAAGDGSGCAAPPSTRARSAR